MEIILLFIVCLVVFVRPVWGIPILIIVTSTLFQLSQYMAVQLPVGYLEPTECIIFALCLRLVLDRQVISKGHSMIQPFAKILEEDVTIKRVLLLAVIPYVIWQSFTILIGAISTAGTDYFRYGMRFFLNGIIPWLIIWVIWQLRYYKDKILYSVALITIITAVVHVVIQAIDYRAIMPIAYWGNPAEEYIFVYEQRMERLGYETLVRALPQGVMLILFFSVYYFSKYIIETYRQKIFFILSIICFIAILITVTRSLLFSALCGFLITVFMAVYYRLYDFTRTSRLFNVLILLVFMTGAYSVLSPSFLNLWQERLDAIRTGTDTKIFSYDNPARGLDNVASIEAIKDSPFLGHGYPRYHHKYSYRNVPPTDIHPLLQIGLVGGMPAILLFLRLLYLIIWKIGLPSLGDSERIIRILPFTVVLIMTACVVNTIGTGGTISGNGLIAMTLFIGLLAVHYPIEVSGVVVNER
jgi:hypothetical protein